MAPSSPFLSSLQSIIPVHARIRRWYRVGQTAGKERPTRQGTKSEREARFPPELQRKGIALQLEGGEASVASDRTHILNSLVGRAAADLDREPLAAHPNYDKVTSLLRGRIAAAVLPSLGGKPLAECRPFFAVLPPSGLVELARGGSCAAPCSKQGRIADRNE